MGKAQLLDYLRGELAISNSAIAVALRHGEQDASQLPMVLWQYGLVTLEQLNLIFDWMEAQPTEQFKFSPRKGRKDAQHRTSRSEWIPIATNK
jgi:hypothetical protein